VLGIGPADLVLALSLGLPLLASALTARLLDRPPAPGQHASASLPHTSSDQFWYTAVAFSIQVALALPAVVLQAEDPVSGIAGSFVTASVYMRIPITFVGGLLVVVLSQVARYHGSGDLRSAERVAKKALLAALAIGILGVTVLWLVSEPALLVLYGEGLDLQSATLPLLGGATVAAMVSGVATQILFGCGLARPAAAVWMGVAVGVTGVAVAVPGTASAMAAAVLLGQVSALLATAALVSAAFRDRS
jgi:O-antigen/teichoic acid export membrane protein